MRKFTKKLLLLFILLSFNSLIAQQNGLSEWVIPGTSSMVFNSSSGTTTSLNTHSSPSNNYTGYSPQKGYANFTDDNGNLLFYVVDDVVYDAEGYFIASVGEIALDFNANPLETQLTVDFMSSDIRIINVPGECNKYYIVFAVDYVNNYSSVEYGAFYVTLDMTQPNRYFPSRSGRLTSIHGDPNNSYNIPFLTPDPTYDKYYARPIAIYNFIDHHQGNGVSLHFTQPLDGERFMYFSGPGGNIVRFVVDDVGFHDDNYDLNDYYSSQHGYTIGGIGTGKMSDGDIVKLQNGNYMIAYPANANTGIYWPVNNLDCRAIIIVTVDGVSGDIIDFGIVNIQSLTNFSVSGIEFSHDGGYLYWIGDELPYIHVVDIVAGSNLNKIYDVTSSFRGATTNVYQDFIGGNIERGVNGSLYFAKSNGMGELSNSNNPNSTWNASAFVFTIDQLTFNYGDPGDKGYALPHGLNNENYNHKVNLNSGNFYFSSQLCYGDEASVYFYNPQNLDVVWPDNSTGNNYTFTVAETGQNYFSCTVTNEFGCSKTRNISYYAGPEVLLDISATTTEYCPKNGEPVISYRHAFQEQGNSIRFARWEKDGVFYSNNINSITADGPGTYCLRIEDDFSGCLSEPVCINITEGPCSVTDPYFTLSTSTNSSDYNVTVTPLETDNCYGHAYYIEDIDNNPWSYYSWNYVQGTIMNSTGSAPYSFNYGTNYRVIHGIWSNCSEYTSYSYVINLDNQSALLRAKNEGVGSLKVEESQNVSIKFFPNPVSKTLNSNLDENNISMVNFYSIDGKKVLSQNESLRKIDVSLLSKGVYIVKVFNINGTIVKTNKIVKH